MLVYIQITVGVHHIGVYTDYSWSSPFYVFTDYRLHLQFTLLVCMQIKGVLSILKGV